MNVPAVSPDLPPGRWRALLALLARLPQGALSRAFGRVADLPIPRPLRPAIVGGFARALGIDVAEAELPAADYDTLNRFFVRRLRAGVRSWPSDPGAAASPVDAVLGQLGSIGAGLLVQAKGRHYTTAALLDDPGEAAAYDGGAFVTLYLSPRHYHRIHTPCAGFVARARHIPGALLPVNAAAVAHVPDLFARNERLVCYVDEQQGRGKGRSKDDFTGTGTGATTGSTGAGPGMATGAGTGTRTRAEGDGEGEGRGLGRVAVVAIGAYNVGRISAAFDPGWGPGEGSSWVTNQPGARAETRAYDPPVVVAAGAEIMAFHLGSTVVLLFRPRVRLDPGLAPGQEVRVGQVIARG